MQINVTQALLLPPGGSGRADELWQTENEMTKVLGPESDAASRSKQRHNVSSEIAHQSWPGMGDMWDRIKDAMEKVTTHVEQSGGDPFRVEEQLHNRTVEAVAIIAAKSINAVLLVINRATDKLLNMTLQNKADLVQALQVLDNSSQDALQLFEFTLNNTLAAGMLGWTVLRGVVDVAGSVLTSSFAAGGQETLSEEFDEVINEGLEKMDEFIHHMGNASLRVAGISKHIGPELHERLRSLDSQFRSALYYVPTFAGLFQQAFQNVMDHLSDALPMSTPMIHDEFQNVLQNVTGIVWRVRSSSRELVLTCHSAVSFAAKTQNCQLPSWEAVMPFDSSASRLAQGLLPGVAFLVALLAVRL